MTEELKPCPLCSHDMKCATWVSNAIDSGEPMSAPMCVCGLQGPMYPTRARAIAAWNTRPTTAATGLREEVARALYESDPRAGGPGSWDKWLAYLAEHQSRILQSTVDKTYRQADAILALLPSVIDGREIVERKGWKLIPVEPTPAMIAAAWEVVTEAKNAKNIRRLGPGVGTVDVYRAMVGTALAPSGDGERG